MGLINDITDLKRGLAAYLENREGLAGARVITAHPAAQRDFPLRGPVVAVGVESVETFPGGLGGYWGERADDPAQGLRGPAAEITLRIDLYAPPSLGGDGLHGLYEALCDHLLLRENPFGVHKLWCDGIAFDKSSAANRMTVRAALRAGLTVREDSAPIESFRLTRKETG